MAQIIILMTQMLSLGIIMARHGEPKEGKENAWHTLIAIMLLQALLYWGGFYDKWI